MNVSSRTPEGEANACHICGKRVVLEPSRPPGDAPCPSCGNLLWFSDEPRSARTRMKPKGHSFPTENMDPTADTQAPGGSGTLYHYPPGHPVTAAEAAEVDAIYALFDKMRFAEAGSA